MTDRVLRNLGCLYLALLLLSLGPRCTPKIVRNADTFQAEVRAAEARQREAMVALFVAASVAKAAGDQEACEAYATPALQIEAYGSAQADRALWLAGLGPEEDPGPSGPMRDPVVFCRSTP